jgi:predicted nucleic acid-binding protein
MKYMFDVGVIALSHADTPVSDEPLRRVRQSIRGEIDAVVPYTAVVGAHHIMTEVYNIPAKEASALLTNFTDSRRIDWYASTTPAVEGLKTAARHGIEGWDGYYVEVARQAGADRILMTDDDFRKTDLDVEILLSDEEFTELNEYIRSLG